ncbi:MAG: 50S ribosomal protein L32e [Candidatus Woesearchaeota archaeon]|jgi:large subunit ribosomal protein L32e|nr:50S ribosomal protein L32e [Candidatus Woesearchaeota archaeon]MDP7623014.1 50S ribosomal protein L32e [Candidatus Woesearchaeota archaeon]HJN56632.1 50S ribosomal protein L32e [Candidatus Woesearchaeota archaeon]|tara:strand:- start:10944 stop:11549 length:606 start_codon:yes stop_codon:yes gene_type:complete
MASIKELLQIRKRIKSKKPDFLRQDHHKKSRLKKKWRRPKGLQSKVRLKLHGRLRKVSSGYRSPRETRCLHKNGLNQKIVRSAGDLESLDSKKDGIVISSALGDKKRIVIIKKAKSSGFDILNIRNPDEFVKKIEDNIQAKKKSKQEKKKKAEEKKQKQLADKVKEKKAEKSKDDKSKTDEKGEKDAKKKEKEKILTQRER